MLTAWRSFAPGFGVDAPAAVRGISSANDVSPVCSRSCKSSCPGLGELSTLSLSGSGTASVVSAAASDVEEIPMLNRAHLLVSWHELCCRR